MPQMRNLLIAEDEPLLLESLVEICTDLPEIRILQAKNGKESLEIIKSKPVDAVLTDINMPIKTGIEVLFEIRQIGIEVPYVILSGYADKKNISQALSLGATDFLEKPFNHEELLKIVDRALTLGKNFRALNAEIEKLVADKKLKPEDFEAVKKARIAMIQMKFTNEFKK